ncbi:uncharacterized protein LOC132756876 [Ruditapes philippinarum]|uniref:uncharacterized protein LOC132756876 n=1 Tax=Ruditapes philippinarum TaxID=129788 RepID=UPI00295C047A|nr:uncharacterized protein LOC132756876 [Ruditapes philippinarum]
MDTQLILVLYGILNARFAFGDTTISIQSDNDCGGVYSLKAGALLITYHGTRLYDCTFTIDSNDSTKKLCAHLETIDIPSCETTIKLYGYNGKNDDRVDFQTYTCGSTDTTEFCPARVTRLHVTFKHPGLQNSDEVRLKISYESDKTYIYLIIGFVAIVIVSVAVPAFLIIRYKRRKRIDNINIQRRYLIATIS